MTRLFTFQTILGICLCSSVDAQTLPPDLVIVGSKEEVAAISSRLNKSGAKIYGLYMPNEIPKNGIDDNEDGFIDNVYGWNGSESKPLETLKLEGNGQPIGVYVIQSGKNISSESIVDLINFSGIRKVVIRDNALRESVLADLNINPRIDPYRGQQLKITILEL